MRCKVNRKGEREVAGGGVVTCHRTRIHQELFPETCRGDAGRLSKSGARTRWVFARPRLAGGRKICPLGQGTERVSALSDTLHRA
jgi:hypothetical protein